MMPMKLTTENEIGTAKSWGHSAAPGVFARDAKSGAFLSSAGISQATLHETEWNILRT